jgi:plasmid stability protein
MSKMIQVRDVPDDVHSTLKSRAAREGMSLSDFLKKELARTAERPTIEEWLDRARQAQPIRSRTSPARAIRELRDSR